MNISFFVIKGPSRNVPSVEQLIPAGAMPVVYRASGDIADVAASLLGALEPSLVLFESVCLAQRAQRDVPAHLMGPRLERIYLLEQIKIAFITPLERLIRLLVPKHLHRALGCPHQYIHIEMHTNAWNAHLADTSSWSHASRSSARPGRGP